MFGRRFFIFLLVFGTLLCSGGGCLHRMRTRPLTPNIVYSREMSREANLAKEQGNWELAEKKLEKAVRINPKEADIRKHYAEVLWEKGKQQESIEQLLLATKLSAQDGAEDAGINISLAEKLLSSRQLIGAERWTQRAIDLAPKEYLAWALHGKVQTALGEEQTQVGDPNRARNYFENAISDYYRALALAPVDSGRNRELVSELASLQMRVGQPEQALASWLNLERSFQPNPPSVELLCGKAETLSALNRTEDAIDSYRIAIEYEPNNPALYARTCELLIRCNRFSEAALAMQKVREIDPNHPALSLLSRNMELAKHHRVSDR